MPVWGTCPRLAARAPLWAHVRPSVVPPQRRVAILVVWMCVSGPAVPPDFPGTACAVPSRARAVHVVPGQATQRGAPSPEGGAAPRWGAPPPDGGTLPQESITIRPPTNNDQASYYLHSIM